MLHTALSRKLGSRPRAKNRRSTSRNATTTAMRAATTVMPSGYEERDPEYQVHRQQLQPLVPRRLALIGDVDGNQDGDEDPTDLEAVEDQRHRVRAKHEAREHE